MFPEILISPKNESRPSLRRCRSKLARVWDNDLAKQGFRFYAVHEKQGAHMSGWPARRAPRRYHCGLPGRGEKRGYVPMHRPASSSILPLPQFFCWLVVVAVRPSFDGREFVRCRLGHLPSHSPSCHGRRRLGRRPPPSPRPISATSIPAAPLSEHAKRSYRGASRWYPAGPLIPLPPSPPPYQRPSSPSARPSLVPAVSIAAAPLPSEPGSAAPTALAPLAVPPRLRPPTTWSDPENLTPLISCDRSFC